MPATSFKDRVQYVGRGVTSGKDVAVEIIRQPAGHGIVFQVTQGEKTATIPARADAVVNTLRNVTLGSNGVRLCIVEHLLAAATLYGLDDLLIKIDGAELPLADGSAKFWIELFASAGWVRESHQATIVLDQSIVCKKGDRMLIAVPDESFSISYHMDWNHPLIGKRWQTWEPTQPIDEITNARTFGSLAEHKMLGLEKDVVSMTADGFTHELRYPDEPVRHKLLDLIGDLTLSGVNPMIFKARFVSIKAGHELDVEMARRLQQLVGRSR
jgi:UDP-3-O-[3-hydroxymyristoyl] N-acetylglucosamine deacetylase